MTTSTPNREAPPARVGRYRVLGELASGGMATVHLGRMDGPAGFSLTVAIKRLHGELASQPEFTAMLRDEARLAGRVRHPNVVPIIDVVEEDDGRLSLVMEYVRGESLANVLKLARAKKAFGAPPSVASAIILDVLEGLHTAHEARDDRGEPLGIVHRDISPQNVMIGADGVARLLDFGIAKATGRLHETLNGMVKGKAPYMSPEQARGKMLDLRTDVYAAGVLLWETLTGRRLFTGKHQVEILMKVFDTIPAAPSTLVPGLDPRVDAVVLKALAKNPDERFSSAKEFALALEAVLPPASPRTVGQWVIVLAGSFIAARAVIEDRADDATDKMAGPPSAVLAEQTLPSLPMNHRGRGRLLLIAAAAIVLVACIAIGVRRKSVSTAEARPVELAQAAVSASTERIPPPAPIASTTPAAVVPAPLPRRARGGMRPNPTTPKPSCDPPYRIDADGIRVPKSECL